jgi:hypothetical protein
MLTGKHLIAGEWVRSPSHFNSSSVIGELHVFLVGQDFERKISSNFRIGPMNFERISRPSSRLESRIYGQNSKKLQLGKLGAIVGAPEAIER